MSLSVLADTEISWGFLTDFKQAPVYSNAAIWAQTSFHRISYQDDEYFWELLNISQDKTLLLTKMPDIILDKAISSDTLILYITVKYYSPLGKQYRIRYS